MRIIQKVSALILGSLMVLSSSVSNADVVGDQHWITPINASPTFHSITYQDETTSISTFPHLTGERYTSDPADWDRFLCSSTSDSHCQNVSQFSYQSIFPICKSVTDLDCIEGLSAISTDGSQIPATFDSYTVPDHVNKFEGNPALGIPKTETPSIWNIPSAPHAYGTQYALVVGQTGSVRVGNYGNETQSQLYASLIPVSKIDVGYIRSESPLHVGYDSLWEAKDANGRTNTPGYAVSTDSCTITLAEVGKCLTSHIFPDGFRYQVKIRLSKEPVAWLHGRMVDPNISLSALSGGAVELAVTAAPTKVPVFYAGVDSSQLTAAQEGIWSTCMTTSNCQSAAGTKDGRAIDYTRPFTPDYSKTLNLWMNMNGFGSNAIKGIQLLAPLVGDKSVALPSAWSFHTLPTDQLTNSDNCFKSGSGLKGIVTTNSTAYSEGPPSFTDGSLKYTVASAHYNPDGTVFKGTYNLVMRSDVARCLYKFTSAPIKASISVVTSDGSNDVATTVSNESNGWLYLSANNFTFSAPTVSIKLTQESTTPTPKPTVAAQKKSTIVCIKGKSTKSVTAVKPTCPTGYKKK